MKQVQVKSKFNGEDTIGTVTESHETMDREILYCAVLSAEYYAAIKDLIKPGTLNKWSGISWSFITDYYAEYAKHPKDIHTYFRLRKAKLNETHVEIVEKLFIEVSQVYPEGREVDVPVMVEETKHYCEMRNIIIAAEQAIDLAQGGDNKAAKGKLEKVLKPSVRDMVKLATDELIPSWPSNVMTGAAGKFAKTYVNYLETPESFLFMNYLTCLGHIVSDKILLSSELNTQPRLFTANLGESARTRKSTSLSKVLNFFKDTLPGEVSCCRGVGSAEGLAGKFETSKKVILFYDELQTIVQKMKIDGSVLLPIIGGLFEDNEYQNFTKKGGIVIEDAQLSVMAASTLDTYRTMFNPRFFNIGFLNRWFVVIGDSEKKFPVPVEMPEIKKQSLRSDLLGVMQFVEDLTTRDGSFVGKTYKYSIEPDAFALFSKWYHEVEVSVFADRLDTYAHRLMPLLAINEMRDTITLDIVKQVITLLNYQLEARKYCNPIDAEGKVAALEEKIRRCLDNGARSRSDLEKACNSKRYETWLWERALSSLKVQTRAQGKGFICFIQKGDNE